MTSPLLLSWRPRDASSCCGTLWLQKAHSFATLLSVASGHSETDRRSPAKTQFPVFLAREYQRKARLLHENRETACEAACCPRSPLSNTALSTETPPFKDEMMLVLSRKTGERIVIAGNNEITVSQIRGNRVRLTVNAPHQVSITRYETRTGHSSSSRRPAVLTLHQASPR